MVIGIKTYGKGIGQTLVKDLPGGTELLVTSFRYETPKGRWPGQGVGPTESRGLAPDMKVDNIPGTVHGTSRDAQLAAALMFVRPLRPPVRRK